jgi:hypothetical protein
MKDQNQLFKEYMLRSVSADFEEIERILSDVTSWAGEGGIAVDRQRALRAMDELISGGYARVYALSPKPRTRRLSSTPLSVWTFFGFT